MNTLHRVNYLRYSILFFVSAALVVLLTIVRIGDKGITAELITFLTFLFALVGIIYKSKEKYPIIISLLILIGFVVKSAYSYHIYKTIFSPFPDSFRYISNLEEMKYSNLSIHSVSGISGTLQFGYYYFMYAIMSIFKTTYSLYIANIFLFSLSSLMFYSVLKEDLGERIARVTTVVLLCSLNMFLYTNNILKDSLVLFLLMLSLYVYKQKKFKVLVVLPLVLLFTVRIYAGASIAAAIIFDFMFLGQLSLRKKLVGTFVFMFSILALSAFSFTSSYITLIKSFLSHSSPVEIIINPIISLYKFYFAPLFWNLIAAQGAYLITFVDSLLALTFSFAVLIFIVKFLRYRELRKKMWIYLIPIYIHALALGIEYGGDSTRQRIGVYGFIILTFVVGLLYKKKNNSERN